MFTTGSKLFLGATGLSIAGAVVFAATTGGAEGWLGAVGLTTLAVVFAFLAGINLYTRDANVPALEPGVEHTAAAAQRAPHGSLWPLVAALGAGGIVVGLVSRPVVFKVSVIVLLAALVEWLVQAWSERASASASYNASIRRRLLNPLEFPILGALVLGVVVYGFSRIMLTAPKSAGRIIFIVIGAVVLFAGFLLASKRGLAKTTVAGVATLGAVALLGVGVVSAVQGQRTIDPHPELTSAVCLGTASAAQTAEIDHRASQAVAMKSSVAANIVLTKDNRLIAFVNGYPNVEFHELTVPRSAEVNVLFRNDSPTARRLTARLGTFKASDGTPGNEQASCTTKLRQGGQAFLSFRVVKPALASSSPYAFIIPGLDGQEIKLLVP